MDNSQTNKIRKREKRALRVRKRVRGNGEKPRLSVRKTGQHLYAQLIDDEKAVTVASVSTVSKEFKNTEFNHKSKDAAKQLGLKIAALAKQKHVSAIVFDRGSFKYHGVIASIADGAREGGLQF